MSAASSTLPAIAAAPRSRPLEQLSLLLLMLAMMALPLLDRLAYWAGVSLPRAAELVSHLSLLLAMLGALLAAASRRLIATPLVLDHLPLPWRHPAANVGRALAAAICVLLARAAWSFALAERGSARELLPGLPIWWVELTLPVILIAISARIVHSGAGSARSLLISLALAAAILGACLLPWSAAGGRMAGLAALAVALACGAPMFCIIGGLGLVLMWASGQPLAAMAVKHYSLATTPVIPTLPLFAFTGYLLAESAAATRLVRVFRACFGCFRGGMAMATVLCCAFFTTFTGASGVTILALGGLLLPALRSAGYGERDSLGLITGSGSIGLLFPPCLPVILYSIVALQTLQGYDPSLLDQYDLSIEGMFTAAFVPGLVLIGLTMLWGWWREPARAADGAPARQRFDWSEARSALWSAKWEMALPVIAIGAMFGGWVSSPVQAAALTASYALLIETVVHRDLKPVRDLPRIAAECGLLTGGILLILGMAMGLTNFLVTEQVPDQLADWVSRYIQSPPLFLLALNLTLLLVGFVMDVYSAIVVVVPLVVPLGLHYGIDPVHLGIIFLVNLELGFLHPPVGINLFLASYRFARPLGEIVRAVLPMLGVVGICVLLITYWPALTHWLPSLLK